MKAATKKSAKDSSSSEEEDSSDEDESEDEEPTKTPKSKDVKMVDAQTVTKSEKKEVTNSFSSAILISQSVICNLVLSLQFLCSPRPQLAIKVRRALFSWEICLFHLK